MAVFYIGCKINFCLKCKSTQTGKQTVAISWYNFMRGRHQNRRREPCLNHRKLQINLTFYQEIATGGEAALAMTCIFCGASQTFKQQFTGTSGGRCGHSLSRARALPERIFSRSPGLMSRVSSSRSSQLGRCQGISEPKSSRWGPWRSRMAWAVALAMAE